MLFSNETTAAMINEQFEPVWVSVRPVPRVSIDFGNGTVVHRTLHGNIATWICLSDGTALDVLPGLYDVPGYTKALAGLKNLHSEISRMESSQRAAALQRHHQACDEALSARPAPQIDATASTLDRDTQWNETIRRQQVHQYLKHSGLIQPQQATPWLYREVLHADLDDPWLGLRSVLFDQYPFADEDAG